MYNLRSANSIEQSILSSLVFASEQKTEFDEVFGLNLNAFENKLNKRIAEKFNSNENNDYFLEMLNIELSVKGTIYETEFIEIMSQTPLPLSVAKKYHDALIIKRKEALL